MSKTRSIPLQTGVHSDKDFSEKSEMSNTNGHLSAAELTSFSTCENLNISRHQLKLWILRKRLEKHWESNLNSMIFCLQGLASLAHLALSMTCHSSSRTCHHKERTDTAVHSIGLAKQSFLSEVRGKPPLVQRMRCLIRS